MGTNIKDLKQRIKFQSLTRTPDGQGGWTESWADYTAPNHTSAEIWAKIKPASASEKLFAQRIEMNTTHKITIRSIEGITQEMRIVFEGRLFQIKGIRRENEERWFTLIDAQENVGS